MDQARIAGFQTGEEGHCKDCSALWLAIRGQSQVVAKLVQSVESLVAFMRMAGLLDPDRVPIQQQAAGYDKDDAVLAAPPGPEAADVMEVEDPRKKRRRRRYRKKKKKSAQVEWVEASAAPPFFSKARKHGVALPFYWREVDVHLPVGQKRFQPADGWSPPSFNKRWRSFSSPVKETRGWASHLPLLKDDL